MLILNLMSNHRSGSAIVPIRAGLSIRRSLWYVIRMPGGVGGSVSSIQINLINRRTNKNGITMKKILGFMAILTLSSAAASESYVGLGGSITRGSGWSGESPELVFGRSFRSGFTLESGVYSIGSRDSFREEDAKGISIEAGYSLTFLSGKSYLSMGGGLYLYNSQYRTGDAGYKNYELAPMFSVSYRYKLKEHLSARLKYSKYILDNSFGSPNRLSATLVYSF